MIVVEPNGNRTRVAGLRRSGPVGEHLGNVLEEPIAEILERTASRRTMSRSTWAVPSTLWPRGLTCWSGRTWEWPETPFGSVTRPVQNPATWLTGLSLLWGETGDEAVLMGAAAVFMKVHRTRSLPVAAELANFGYRVLLLNVMGQNLGGGGWWPGSGHGGWPAATDRPVDRVGRCRPAPPATGMAAIRASAPARPRTVRRLVGVLDSDAQHLPCRLGRRGTPPRWRVPAATHTNTSKLTADHVVRT